MKIERAWLFWQVFVPIFGQGLVSLMTVVLWMSGNAGFVPDFKIILDTATPWALTFYALTLIGATLNEFWPRMAAHPALGWSLIFNAFAVALYASFMVIWRHDPNFAPGTSVYTTTLVLLLISVVLCHVGYSKRSGA